MKTRDCETLRRIEKANGILVDWDGCVAFGDVPTQWGLALLARHREKVAILSNNSTHLPDDFAAILGGYGLSFPSRRIVLAGAEALRRTAELKHKSVQVLACPRMQHYARDVLGIPLVEQDGDCVVLLRDTGFSYRRLEAAANALRRGASLIVANPDFTHPGSGGSVVPETGALFAALKSCVDMSKVNIEVIGKPSPELFFEACMALGTAPQDSIMIGDNPQTDIEGARRAGLEAILVKSESDFAIEGIFPEFAE